MDDEAKFELVLDELRRLLLGFASIGLDVVLIGGQVIAVWNKANTGSGRIHIAGETGVNVERGYSMEPDLLVELPEAETDRQHEDLLSDVMKQHGFTRGQPDTRWFKVTPLLTMQVDLFAPEDTPSKGRTTPMTSLPRAYAATTCCERLVVRLPENKVLEVRLPDALGFLSLKAYASLRLRSKPKDAFDAFVYVAQVGLQQVAQSFAKRPPLGRQVLSELRQLFETVESAGVKDVVAEANLFDTEADALLARQVVDMFQELDKRVRQLVDPGAEFDA
ncbi:MAG: hypothetical protein JST92_25090 [Deltaproteobacteria bacterium]|nr:hypothetical protein [Deltaproteobacteria bacterium]